METFHLVVINMNWIDGFIHLIETLVRVSAAVIFAR
jgi:hypothetical protein